MPEDSTPTMANLVGGPVQKTRLATPLQSSIAEQGEQIAKLFELVSTLEDRLKPVLNETPPVEGQNAVDPMPPASQFVYQVKRQTAMIQGLQSRVSKLLNELEV